MHQTKKKLRMRDRSRIIMSFLYRELELHLLEDTDQALKKALQTKETMEWPIEFMVVV